ncbi:MAG: leucine-rich repeat protein [Oscillospiraceae bacterium]|nr:leucine-rich repeat protein [Oscillospiraceae bacterium]
MAIFISIFTVLNVSAETFSGDGWSFDSDTGTLTVSTHEGTYWWRTQKPSSVEFSDITTIIIGNSVTHIGDDAFRSTGITTITIPESVIYVTAPAFSNCTNLTAITVAPANSNFSDIDGVLFNKDATELIKYPNGNARTSYTIPNSVTSIPQEAFAFITAPLSITFNSQTPPTFGGNVFFQNTGEITIVVPYGAKAAYAEIWQLSNFTIHERPAPAIHDDNENNNRGGNFVRDTIISGGGIGGAAGNINGNNNSEINGHFENDTYIKHSEIPLVYTADKNFADFREVRINGRRLTKGTHYTVKSGSTIITLLPEYLDTLDEGEHELSVHFSGLAVVKASFTIENAEYDEYDDVSTLAGILEDFDSIDN